MSDPTVRIVKVVRLVDGKLMEHSDVFIEVDGLTFYTRYWWVVADTPHMKANELQQLKVRRARHGH